MRFDKPSDALVYARFHKMLDQIFMSHAGVYVGDHPAGAFRISEADLLDLCA